MLDRNEIDLLAREPAGLQQIVVIGAITLLGAAMLAIFLDMHVAERSGSTNCAASDQATCVDRPPAKGANIPAIAR